MFEEMSKGYSDAASLQEYAQLDVGFTIKDCKFGVAGMS